MTKKGFFLGFFLFFFQFLWGNVTSVTSHTTAQTIYIYESLKDTLEQEIAYLRYRYDYVDPNSFIALNNLFISIYANKDFETQNKVFYLNALRSFMKRESLQIDFKDNLKSKAFIQKINKIPNYLHYHHNGELLYYTLKDPKETIDFIDFVLYDKAVFFNFLQILAVSHPDILWSNYGKIPITDAELESLYFKAFWSNPLMYSQQLQSQLLLHQKTNTLGWKDVNSWAKTQRLFTNPSAIISTEGIIGSLKKNDIQSLIKVTNIVLNSEQHELVHFANEYIQNNQFEFLVDIHSPKSELYKFLQIDQLFFYIIIHNKNIEKDQWPKIFDNINKKFTEKSISNINFIEKVPYRVLFDFLYQLEQLNLDNEFYVHLDMELVKNLMAYNMQYNIHNNANSILDSTLYYLNKKTLHYETKASLSRKTQKISQINRQLKDYLQWTRNINELDAKFEEMLQIENAEYIVNYLTQFHPQILLKHHDKISNEKIAAEALLKLAKYHPSALKSYLLAKNHPMHQKIQNMRSYSKVINHLFYIEKHFGISSELYPITEFIDNENAAKLEMMSKDEAKWLEYLSMTLIDKNPSAKTEIEKYLRERFLKILRHINDNPNKSNQQLQMIQSWDYKTLYVMIVLAKEELFGFAFDEVYKVFDHKLRKNDINIYKILVQFYGYKHIEFCNLLSKFNKFEAQLDYLTPKELQGLVQKLVYYEFTNPKAIEDAAILSELIASITNIETLNLFSIQIFNQYQVSYKYQDELYQTIFGILASNIGKKSPYETAWFEAMSKLYQKYTYTKLDISNLISNNSIIELVFFYNDEDGRMSYKNFLSTYQNKAFWLVQDLGTYVFISSLQGQKIEIFANKPQYRDKGMDEINAYIRSNNLNPGVVVHRGHSFHANKTIEYMIGNPPLIFMGSCGGYFKIPELMERSTKSQIISTKQVGTMSINDPLLYEINERIRNNIDLDWQAFWLEMNQKFSKNYKFKDYVPPHQNTSALFINSLYSVLGM